MRQYLIRRSDRVVETVAVELGGVSYGVLLDEEPVWNAHVAFGTAKAHRAGGSAFQSAAREQERKALQLIDENQIH